MAKKKVKFTQTTPEKLDTVSLLDGQIIFVQDDSSNAIFVDQDDGDGNVVRKPAGGGATDGMTLEEAIAATSTTAKSISAKVLADATDTRIATSASALELSYMYELYPITHTTTFPSDGSIVDTYTDGTVVQTIFNADGSIETRCTVNDTLKLKNTVVFNDDGSISNIVEQ